MKEEPPTVSYPTEPIIPSRTPTPDPHPLHYWRRKNRYYHQDLEALHQFLIPPGKRVLEIGSGTGELLNLLNPSYGLGIDLDPAIVAQAQTAFPHLTFKIQDAHQLDLEGPFDYIILANTISFLVDIQVVLEKLRDLCHANTRLVIAYQNPLWEPIVRLATQLKQRIQLPTLNWLSASDVKNLLSLAGFEVVKQGKRMIFPRWIPLLSPLLNRYLAPLPIINTLCLLEFMVARLHPDPQLARERIAKTSCSVIIPARNEAGNILNCVKNLPPMGSHTEIIFVEGNSSDHTWDEMQRIRAELGHLFDIKILQQEGKGKADAVRKGFAAATGDVLVILDADLTVQAEDMPKFFSAVASGYCDFANGCRLVYPLSESSMPTINRWANRFFAALLSYILSIRIKDSLCGTKVLWRSHYLDIQDNRHYFGDFDPFGDFDLLLGATKQNLKIVDVPVRYYPRVYGRSNIQHVRDGIKLLKICWFAARKFKFGSYQR
jgi:hypothetical protein